MQLALVGSNDSLTIEKGEKAEYMDGTDANGWVDATRGRMGNFSSNCYLKKKKQNRKRGRYQLRELSKGERLEVSGERR